MTHAPDAATGLTEAVQARYGEAARQVLAGAGRASCCGPAVAAPRRDPISGDLYDPAVAATLPAEAVLASLGCGNPTALADLHEGETVLDLGSGGGIDVLLSARRVGPTGRAYGLDMTDDMLALARANQARAGVANAEFLKGSIERIPLPDASVDVIISNCVINLSGDKPQVLREAFRVLRPGGRFAVADVVTTGPVPDDVRQSVALWVGCLAGALEEGTFRALLAEAGFTGIEVEPTRVYRVEDARDLLRDAGVDADALGPLVDGKFMSAFVRAVKPAARAIAVFDPAMCCSTGVCGPSVDPALARVAADLDWLRGHGVQVARHNLAQEPAAFAASAAVRDVLATRGPDALPLVLADGAIVASGAYPTRAALARLAGVPLGPAAAKRSIPLGVAPEGCCGGDGSAPCC